MILPLQASYVVLRASSPVRPNIEGRVDVVVIVIGIVAANHPVREVMKLGGSHLIFFAAPLMLMFARNLELGYYG